MMFDMRNSQCLLIYSVCLISMFYSSETLSVGSFKPTEQELKLLPPYCKPKAVNLNATVGPYQKYRPLIPKWKKLLGPDYAHLHHYCEALQFLNKSYLEHDPDKRKFYYSVAISNIEYMERNASKNFVLNPQIAVTKGDILHKMGNNSAAISEYKKAIKYKKNYPSPYAKIFDIYMKLGDKTKAGNALKMGLKYNPNSKMLKRREKIINK